MVQKNGTNKSIKTDTVELAYTDVSYTYVTDHGQHPALLDLSLTVREGEFVAVVGPSGCGKSTLLHLGAGFLYPNNGEIRHRDAIVTCPSTLRGVVFQDHLLFDWQTVEGNLTWVFHARGIGVDRQAVNEYLEKARLEDVRYHYPFELSGGQRQRLAFSRALIGEPTILMLDEPFGSLDEQTRSEMHQFLQRVLHGTNKSVLLVTHHIEEAILLADKIYVLTPRPGRVKFIESIPFKKPRSLELRFSLEAIALRKKISEQLGDK